MVKRADVLAGVDREAEIPYAEQPIARRAPRARMSTCLLLSLWTLLFLLYAWGRPAWLLASAFAAWSAWIVWNGRLAGLVGAGFIALLGTGVPLALWASKVAPFPTGGVPFLLGIAMLPALVTLAKDAELQHAYGLWARR